MAVAKQDLAVVEENGRRAYEEGGTVETRNERLVALGRALSDPIRVQMLGMMAEGRGCCGTLPDRGVPAGADEEDLGLCVCEFEDHFGMGQSKVSYHVKKLKEAGLVREQKRGKWSFYSLDGDAARELLGEAAGHLGVEGEL